MGVSNLKKTDVWIIIAWALAFSYLSYSLFPIYWMFVTSLKDNTTAYKMPPDFLPLKPTLNSYFKLFTSDRTVLHFFFNSLVISGGVVLVCLICGLLGGYALSRLRSKLSRFLTILILVSQMFPLAVLSIPLYTYFFKLHLLDTYGSVILTHSAIALPLCIWLLKGFFDTIPIELEEVAKIDGCGRWMIFTRIVLPLVIPGMITAAVFAFLTSWREFLFALIFTTTEASRPLSPGIAVYYLGFTSIRWPDVMATSILACIPLFIIYIFLQKYVISGLTAGAVKG
mgnify:CR=1 FL=1